MLPRTVVALGVVSFLNDFASDLVIPVIPLLLATTLASGPAALGLIEGVAESVASLLKLWAGRHSDVMKGRRKPLVVAGYLVSNVARPLLATATSWLGVLVLRGIDRVGKGIRTAPRDAMIADVVTAKNAGRAYGLHRALDNAGAVMGSLAAAALLAGVAAGDLRAVLWYSAIPGALGVLVLVLGVPGAAGPAGEPPAAPVLSWRALAPRTRRFLVLLVLTSLARVTETFVMMRGHELGRGAVELLVLWSALSLARAACAYGGGKVSDRVGTPAVVALSWSGNAVAFCAFAATSGAMGLWAASLFYGAVLGFGEGAERALIAERAAAAARGTAFGWYHLVVGLSAVPAGAVFGLVWQVCGAGTAYLAAAAVTAAGVLLLRTWARA